MDKYKSREYGWWLLGLFIPFQVFITLAWIFQWGSKPISLFPFLLISSIFPILILLMYKMEIILDDELLHIKYGIGIIHIRIRINTIVSIDALKNPWYYGLGIHFIPNGILYNIHCMKAVQLRLSNKSTVVRIGCEDPHILKLELEKRIRQMELSRSR